MQRYCFFFLIVMRYAIYFVTGWVGEARVRLRRVSVGAGLRVRVFNLD